MSILNHNYLIYLVMHPVRLAALAHYKLVYIHPFVDGNGRTSRLLMNLILMQVIFLANKTYLGNLKLIKLLNH